MSPDRLEHQRFLLKERSKASVKAMQCLRYRQSIRSFSDKTIEGKDIRLIMKAATWAPTAGNKQPWRFVVICDKSRIDAIRTFSPGLIGLPKVLVVACTIIPKGGAASRTSSDIDIAVFDVSMACENLMLAAWSLGLGTCVIRGFNQRAISKITLLPKNIIPQLIVAIGYPATIPLKPKRKPLTEVVYFETFQGGCKI